MIDPATVPEYIRKSSWLTRDKFTAEDWKLYWAYNKAVRYESEYEAQQDNDRQLEAMGI